LLGAVFSHSNIQKAWDIKDGMSIKEAILLSRSADVDNPVDCRACVESTFVIVIGG
jgi:hypothetical protein